MTETVAVLGAGIMGSCTALHLARTGRRVVLFDEALEPFSGASRWNEGKIHLGFLYAADPSLRTARAVLDGGLEFRDQVERLTGASIESAIAPIDDNYLVHPDSVVDDDAIERYFEQVSALVAGHPAAPRYLTDVSRCAARRLTPGELEAMAAPGSAVAGFRVPERSVDTRVVADAFVDALHNESSVELALGSSVTAVDRVGDADDEWIVRAGGEVHGRFGAVVNALWAGRPGIDRTIGHRPDVDPQFRYRVSLFVRTREPVDVPCAVLCVGPFGDVKNFGGRSFYLSWYPAGLLASSDGEQPPEPVVADGDRDRVTVEVFDALRTRLPWVGQIEQSMVECRVEGGWVYSQGNGLLDDPRATVHRRNRLGITRVGTYFSVDTGKYSVAPTLADQLARMIGS